MVVMLKSNFLAALHIAIEDRRKVEKANGYTGDSIYVAGLLQIKKEVEEQPDGPVRVELRD